MPVECWVKEGTHEFLTKLKCHSDLKEKKNYYKTERNSKSIALESPLEKYGHNPAN